MCLGICMANYSKLIGKSAADAPKKQCKNLKVLREKYSKLHS